MASTSGVYSLARGAEIDVRLEAPNTAASCDLRFLIDDGAHMSRVKTSIAERLSLQSLGKVLTNSSTNKDHPTETWQALVKIPALGFCSSPMRVGAFIEDPAIDGLLGRDILIRMLLKNNGPAGQYTLIWDQDADRDPLATDDSY